MNEPLTSLLHKIIKRGDTEETDIPQLKHKDIVIAYVYRPSPSATPFNIDADRVVHPSDAEKTTFIQRASDKPGLVNLSFDKSPEMGPFMIHRLVVKDTGNPSSTPDVVLIDTFAGTHQDGGTLENLSQCLQNLKINISGILWMRKSQDDQFRNMRAIIAKLCRNQETKKVIVVTMEAPNGESRQEEDFRVLHLEEKWESAWRILGLLVARELNTRWEKVQSDSASLISFRWQKLKKEKIVPQIVLDQIPKIREKLDGVEKTTLEGGSEPDSLTAHLAILRQQQSLQNNALSQLRMKKLIAASANVIPGCYRLKDIHLDQSYPVAQGGFGVVYKGTWGSRPVSLKVVHLAHEGDESRKVDKSPKDYAQELTLWAHLSHPNILPLYGVFTIGHQPALVSPWMPKGNLQSYVHENPGVLKIPLILKVTEGLNYLHSVGIIHGDLKGSNVLVSGDGEPVIANFGLSRTAVNTETGAGSQESCFTGRWAAPETLVASDTTPSGDIWGLACVMYEAVSCKLPYDQYHRYEQVVTAICVRKEAPGQQAGTDKEGDGLWTLMKKCWNWDPNQRPTCQDVLGDLRKLVSPHDLPVESEVKPGGVRKEIAIVKLSRSDYERVLYIYARVISKYPQAPSMLIDSHSESSNSHSFAVSRDGEEITQASTTSTGNPVALRHVLNKFFRD
ncbi:putative serine/threonine-protein kinase gdt2 [Leucoagaricus sp. SymC.cos]|nr:putative serine/threonine-protein kinase gdt2 [Leucoagaricus sp. SymC.cos]